jgi:hypothetical protein
MRTAALLLIAATSVAACTSHEPEPASEAAVQAPAAPARAWPQTFVAPAVLVAREVSIEGPPGLLEHLALRQDPAHEHSVRTVPEGLLMEVAPRADAAPEPIRCYLDQLEIAAEASLRVLQRPGDCELTVTARGDAFFQRPGEPERRGELLRLAESGPR